MSYWYAARTASPRAHPVCRERPRPARAGGAWAWPPPRYPFPLPAALRGRQTRTVQVFSPLIRQSYQHSSLGRYKLRRTLADTKHDANTPVAWIPPHVQQARCKHLPTPGTNLLQKASHYYSRQFRTPLNHPRRTLLSPRLCNQQCQAYRIVQQAAL